MAVTIEIRENEQTIKTMDLADGRYTIGRDPGADIVLAGKTVSKNHATLVVEKEAVTVIDNNSANGVFVDGKKIAEKTFKNGFQIEVTPFSIRTAGREPSAAPAGDEAAALVPDAISLTVSRNFKSVLGLLVVLAMLGCVLFVYVPLKNSAEAVYQQERLQNGILLGRYLAEINRPFLKSGDLGLVETTQVRQAEGVLYAFVLDGHGRIIAPHEQQGDFFNWEGLAGALRNGRLLIEKGSRGENVIFSPVIHQDRVLGAAIIGFAVDGGKGMPDAGLGAGAVFLLLVLFGLTLAAVVYLVNQFLKPVRLFSEAVEVSIKEGRDQVEFEVPDEALENLKRSINRLLLRRTPGAETHPPGRAVPPEIPGGTPTGQPAAAAAEPESVSAEAAPAVPAEPAGPWCLVDSENYTLVRLSETFTQDLGLAACREGMHIIEAFDGEVITTVTQIIEEPDQTTLEVDAAGKKYRVSGIRQNKGQTTVLIVFEEAGS